MAAELGVKVHCDTHELLEGESRISHFADHFEKKFMRKFSHAFGAAGLAIGAFNLIEGIFGKPEEIDKVAKHWQMTTDEVQLLEQAFKKMGLTFEEGMEKAKEGAIDLTEVLRGIREKGGIIAGEDIKTLTEDVNTLKGLKDTIQNWLIRQAAKGARGGKSLWAERMEQMGEMNGKDYFRNILGIPGEIGAGGISEIPTNIPTGDWGRGESGLDPAGELMLSPGASRIARMAAIRKEIEELRRQRRELQHGSPEYELLAPNLTSRQTVGAFSSQQGSLVTKVDEVKQAIEAIDKRLEELGNSVS